MLCLLIQLRWLANGMACSDTLSIEVKLFKSFDLAYSFIHSFGHFYSALSSPLLLRGAPDYSTDTVSEFHAEAHRQL